MKCDECGKEFTDSEALEEHLYEHYEEIKERLEEHVQRPPDLVVGRGDESESSE